MRPRITLFLSTVFHFLVDLSCIYFLTGVMIPMAISHEEWLSWAVFYNFMAFALPALLGWLMDRFLPHDNLYPAVVGMCLVACGYLCYRFPLPAIFLAVVLFRPTGFTQSIRHKGSKEKSILPNLFRNLLKIYAIFVPLFSG